MENILSTSLLFIMERIKLFILLSKTIILNYQITVLFGSMIKLLKDLNIVSDKIHLQIIITVGDLTSILQLS